MNHYNKEIKYQEIDYATFYPEGKRCGPNERLIHCPFHDDHRESLSINLKTGLWYCHACGAKGNYKTWCYKMGIALKQINTESDYIQKNKILFNGTIIKNQKYLDRSIVQKSQTNLENQIFVKPLINLGFTLQHFINWNVGEDINGNTLFFCRDIFGRIVNVKKILYKEDLHRDKDAELKYCYSKYYGYGQCLYGEHFIKYVNKSTPILLVESEKTAIIASHCMPEKIWMAYGSATGLTASKAKVLKGYPIYLVVDSDPAGRENAKKARKYLLRIGIKSEIIDLFKNENNGKDIADYLIDKLIDLNKQVTILPKNVHELFEERAAILQYHYDMNRYEADLQALNRIRITNE